MFAKFVTASRKISTNQKHPITITIQNTGSTGEESESIDISEDDAREFSRKLYDLCELELK